MTQDVCNEEVGKWPPYSSADNDNYYNNNKQTPLDVWLW